jgi:hypothetical protein
MEIEILDSSGVVVNTILADAGFANEFYPNRWRERVSPEPVPPSLDEVKADKISEIKAEAESRITAICRFPGAEDFTATLRPGRIDMNQQVFGASLKRTP